MGRVLADKHGGEVGVDDAGGSDLILTTPNRGTRDFAQANYTFVGEYLDHEKERVCMIAAPAANGAIGIDRNTDRNGFNLCNFHGLVIQP